jgi:hypothetical protein
MFLARINQPHAAVSLSSHIYDLIFNDSAFRHSNLLVRLCEKILPSMLLYLGYKSTTLQHAKPILGKS